jgi:hypothetical protein
MQSVLAIVIPAGDVYAVLAIAANVSEPAGVGQLVGQVPAFVQFDAKAGKEITTTRRTQRISLICPDRSVPCSHLTRRAAELRAIGDPESGARCRW